MKTRTSKLIAKTFVRIRSLLIRSPWPRGFLLIPLVVGLACIVPGAALACDEICDDYPELNTSWGTYGLTDLTTGTHNTAFGFGVLDSITSEVGNTAVGCNAMTEHKGDYNTAIGREALYGPSTSSENTATGAFALSNSGDGACNTANGAYALYDNTSASYNVANGAYALHHNTTASYNVATGAYALYDNHTGSANTACGYTALYNNDGSNNTATGFQALNQNTTGQNNTAIGINALFTTTTGSNNIGIGAGAGAFLTTGSNNIDIGNSGVTAEANTIRIGITGLHANTYVAGIYGAARSRTSVPVYVDSAGRLGTSTSSARFKDQIKPMDRASEAIFTLKPVTFNYKKELDPEGTAQFGLIAEEVAKVNPDLVVRDEEGKPYTVRYEAVNAMLLNEFLKEHRKVEEQEATIIQLKSDLAKQGAAMTRQQKGMEALTGALKEQAVEIRRVNAQVELNKPAARVVATNQ